MNISNRACDEHHEATHSTVYTLSQSLPCKDFHETRFHTLSKCCTADLMSKSERHTCKSHQNNTNRCRRFTRGHGIEVIYTRYTSRNGKHRTQMYPLKISAAPDRTHAIYTFWTSITSGKAAVHKEKQTSCWQNWSGFVLNVRLSSENYTSLLR